MRWSLNPFQKNDSNKQVFHLADLMLEAQAIAQSLSIGVHGRKKAGIGERFWQFREYTQGDDIKQIDWRQSAKSDSVFLRELEWEAAQTALFWLDTRKPMFVKTNRAKRSKYEAAGLIALSLANAMMRSSENVGTLLPSSVTPGYSYKTYQMLGQAWASEAPSNTPDLPTYRALPGQKNIAAIVISDGWDTISDLSDFLLPIKKQSDQLLFIQIHDPAEVQLDYRGAVKFSEFYKDESLLFQNVADIRDVFQSNVEKHINDVARLCQKLAVKHVYHRTDKSVLPCIQNACRALAGVMQ